jgi:2-phosphoglycerate kinase
MVILVGGVSCTGKTLMAQKLMETYKIPYLSIDHLKMGLIKGLPDCGFQAEDSSRVIGDKLWPILKGILMTNIENGQNIIMEGCYLLPDLVKQIPPESQDKIISIYLGFSRNYIEKKLISGMIAHRCVIEQRGYEESRSREQLFLEHEELKQLCQENGANYFEIDMDYETEINRVYEWIDRRMKEAGFLC